MRRLMLSIILWPLISSIMTDPYERSYGKPWYASVQFEFAPRQRAFGRTGKSIIQTRVTVLDPRWRGEYTLCLDSVESRRGCVSVRILGRAELDAHLRTWILKVGEEAEYPPLGS